MKVQQTNRTSPAPRPSAPRSAGDGPPADQVELSGGLASPGLIPAPGSSRSATLQKLLKTVRPEDWAGFEDRLKIYPDDALKVASHQISRFERMSLRTTMTSDTHGEYLENDRHIRYAQFSLVRDPRQTTRGQLAQVVATGMKVAGLAIPLAAIAVPLATGNFQQALANPNAIAGVALGVAGGALLGAGGLEIGKVLDRAELVSRTDVIEHELVHSLDHALGLSDKYKNQPIVKNDYLKYYDGKTLIPEATEYFSLRSPEVIRLYEAAASGVEGHDFVTSYAWTHPSEYLAESVKSYLKPETLPEPNRAKLKKCDPEMYNFVEKFLREEIPALAARLPG